MPRALISVSDKSGVVPFASTLVDMGWEIIASGGTERELRAAQIPVTTIRQVTSFEELLGGRVKTLHPSIHAGILARDTAEDFAELSRHRIAPIQIVVCNLYPFSETITRTGISLQDAIEQIDIGGVALLRAGAKNFLRVTTVSDPEDYHRIIASLRASGEVDLAMRRELAQKAFALTRDYDTAIHAYLMESDTAPNLDPNIPERMNIQVYNVESLRYGENAHQQGAFFSTNPNGSPLGGQQLGGKQLSYNNILDIDAAWQAASSFFEPTVVIVKHLSPTGIACADHIAQAYPMAFASDPVSAFGGVIAVNQVVDEAFVTALDTIFIEAIAAPGFEPGAVAALTSSRKSCRLIELSQSYDPSQLQVKSVHGGMLVQQVDTGDPQGTILKTVTQRMPTPEELRALQFAWKAVQHVKSNAIVLAKEGRTVGIGGGLSSRVDAVELAVKKAGDEAVGSVMASDAFFPFADGIEAAIKAGVTAVIQPGGSIRDNEVIEAADQANIAMVVTRTRHFKH